MKSSLASAALCGAIKRCAAAGRGGIVAGISLQECAVYRGDGVVLCRRARVARLTKFAVNVGE